MAQTGKAIPITPAQRLAGFPLVEGSLIGEASSQTYTAGAPLYINASGVLQVGASYPQTIYGFARIAGQNGATDGAKTPSVYKARVDDLFVCTLSGTWSSSYVGVKAMLSASSSTFVAKISTGDSASYNVIIRGLDPRGRWAVGDVNPAILVSVIDTKIQGDAIANVAS